MLSGWQVQAHADRVGAATIVAPIEQALGLARSPAPGQGQRTDILQDIMGPLEDMLRSMGPAGSKTPAAGKRTRHAREAEPGPSLPLAERVDKIVAECSARQATVSQLQQDLTRCGSRHRTCRRHYDNETQAGVTWGQSAALPQLAIMQGARLVGRCWKHTAWNSLSILHVPAVSAADHSPAMRCMEAAPSTCTAGWPSWACMAESQAMAAWMELGPGWSWPGPDRSPHV